MSEPILEKILDQCEKVCDVSRIKFELFLKFDHHRQYFPNIEDLTIHNIPAKNDTFIISVKKMLVDRMKRKSKHNELCIGLNESVVIQSSETSNFILFLKIDDMPQGVVIGNMNDNKRKAMIFIDIFCSNPVKYGGIGKHLLDFFKSIIFLNCDPDNPGSIHSSIHLKSIDSKNTIDFYERNGMKNIEDETKDSLYPYIWKLSYLYEEDDPEATELELINYKVNDGIKWFSPKKFSGRRALLDIDILGAPTKRIKTRKNSK